LDICVSFHLTSSSPRLQTLFRPPSLSALRVPHGSITHPQISNHPAVNCCVPSQSPIVTIISIVHYIQINVHAWRPLVLLYRVGNHGTCRRYARNSILHVVPARCLRHSASRLLRATSIMLTQTTLKSTSASVECPFFDCPGADTQGTAPSAVRQPQFNVL
jgi:hypothetical protein